MKITTTEKVALRTNLADYPVTMALKEGRVTSPALRFDFCGPKVAHDGFKAMFRDNAFDAGEVAIITFLQAKAFGKPYVLLPAVISGRFQHQYIGYNSEHGELRPRDIEGKKVGVRSYAQTTGLWVRGTLQHQYGVDLDKVTWVTVEDAHLGEYRDPSNCERLPPGTKLDRLMMDGEIAAAILVADMPKDPRVRTLIPDPAADAQAWYQRDDVIPINHMFVVHQDIASQRPDLVKEILRMLAESRAQAPAEITSRLPPFGLEANRKGLEMAIDWSFEQKIIPRRFSVDELFDDATVAMTA